MTESKGLDIPPEWRKIDLEQLHGTVMIIGAPDTGKSTFALYLTQCFLEYETKRVAFLDGDPGQSSLGIPSTISLVLSAQVTEGGLLMTKEDKKYFIGSNSPQAHMLPMLVGGVKLIKAAEEGGKDLVIYDTSGLIDPNQGGIALKSAKIDSLNPSAVIAIQSEASELEPLLYPYRRSKRIRIIDLKPSTVVLKKSQEHRLLHRSQLYRNYFKDSHFLTIDWNTCPIFPIPRFSMNRLIAFEDRNGFTVSLGIVTDLDRVKGQVTIYTPMQSMRNINAIRIGDMSLEITTFRDQRII